MHVYNISIFYQVVTHNINKFKRRNKHRNIKQTWKLTKFWICFIISSIITRKQYDESVKRTAANHLSFSFYKQNKKYLKKPQKNQNKTRKGKLSMWRQKSGFFTVSIFHCRSKNENIMLISVGHICTTEMKLTRKL